MNEKDIELLEEAIPLFGIDSSEMENIVAYSQSKDVIEFDGKNIADKKVNIDAITLKSSKVDSSAGYVSKWSSSKVDTRSNISHDGHGHGDDNNSGDEMKSDGDDDNSLAAYSSIADESVIDIYDLPDFADDECRALSREIKMLEKKRDDASSNAKEHRDRVTLMESHLNNVRQEIVHTNGLLAAKQKEIDTEKHLIALAEREKAAMVKEIHDSDVAINEEKEKIRSLQSQMIVSNEEMDKLKLSLNWNQEELEQWATAAAKKESDNLALEKFQRADEVKIKDLILKLEHLTKLSVEKQAGLENEKTETQSKQLEIDRVTKLFKANHDERRQLVDQWQKTVNAMKERDAEIEKLSTEYREVTSTLDIQTRDIAVKREEIFDMKTQLEESLKESEATNRIVQTKRQDKIDEDEILRSLQVEVDVLKAESIVSSQSLQKAKTRSKVAAEEFAEKTKQLDLFQRRAEDIKKQLKSEKDNTLSKEKISQNAEDRFNAREKELKDTKKRNEDLRQRLFQESQNIAKLREKELGLIAEIKSAQSTAKNIRSKMIHLEREREKQQELLYNAEFKLQQIERKVARGLGERSDEEKEKLLMRIKELEEEVVAKRQRNRKLNQQYKILKQELRKWGKTREQCDSKRMALERNIDEVELEIVSCELNLQKLNKEKEEDMVSLDLARLEVRRLRDILKKKTNEVYELEDIRDDIGAKAKETKQQVCLETELWVAQLRAAEDERHKCKIELGQRSIASEKMQMKYEMITTAHNTKNGNEGEGHSPVYYLIAAAQKRADLQRQGDQLDADIRKKEKEMNAMKKTLTHLKQRNTDFRYSFAKVDNNSIEYKSMAALEETLKKTEKEVFKAKKTMHDTQRIYESEVRTLQKLETEIKDIRDANLILEAKKKSILSEIAEFENKIRSTTEVIAEESIRHKARDYPNVKLNRIELSTQELCFHADLKEAHFSHTVKMLVEIGSEFPDVKNSIIASLTREGISLIA